MYDKDGKRVFIDKLYEWTEPISGSAAPGESPENVKVKEEEYYKSLRQK